ncbi:endonuclease/exonuclease/phosphatase family protein [Paenibacillus sp. HJGM_3]
MTYNMRHAQGADGQVDLNRVARLLQTSQADVIALQEVDRYWGRSGNRDQIKALADRLGMEWRFSPSLNDGKRQYGNALLSKYPIDRSESILLPGKQEQRSLLDARLLIGEAILRVVTTHLGVTSSDRQSQLERIRQQLADDEGPTVLLGDWNMAADDPNLVHHLPQWTILPLPVGASTLVSGDAIDHIFVNFDAGGAVARAWPSLASDHFPVMAHFIVPGSRLLPKQPNSMIN